MIVTGCYDWFHSGHVRFFEEVSGLGDLYVVVGHDANIKLLKGEGHPMFSQDERRYMVQSVRFVKQALISSGHGWMDAEPEIAVIKPDIYAVNEDGDVPEKRAFCKEHGIEYVVLKRIPKAGLPKRQSTNSARILIPRLPVGNMRPSTLQLAFSPVILSPPLFGGRRISDFPSLAVEGRHTAEILRSARNDRQRARH